VLLRGRTGGYTGVGMGVQGQGGMPVVNVIVTDNNMYGKLDNETARIWAQQLGFATMNRLASRKGIGVR